MKTLKSLSIALLAGMLFVLAAPAQTILTQTTLSAKIADTSTKVITLTSATGVSAPTMPSIQANNLGSVLYIDRELMDVQAVNGTYITVRRAAGSTKAKAHASGALVFISTPNQFFVAPPSAGGGDPGGACTRTSETVLPYINVTTGNISDCLGGQWVVGVRTANTPYRLNFPATGAVANTSLGTSTSVGATTVYCTEVNLPFNKLLTGIAVLNGTTNTNDHRYVILYDSTGNVIANSATTGTVTATNSVYQARAFTTKYYAVGPAQYFACFQDSVGSDAVMMAVTGTNDNLLTAGQTGATFGTIPALTVPTSFTTAVGPYVYLY